MDVLGLRRMISNPSDQKHRGRSGPTGALRLAFRLSSKRGTRCDQDLRFDGIAWENHRARSNHALGMGYRGFCRGSYCLLAGIPRKGGYQGWRSTNEAPEHRAYLQAMAYLRDRRRPPAAGRLASATLYPHM